MEFQLKNLYWNTNWLTTYRNIIRQDDSDKAKF